MLVIILQIWGGLFYLLNKICFFKAEKSTLPHRKRSWRIRSWFVYLTGLPAWIVIFISEHNWIAAAVESGGAPAMVIGLIIAVKGKGTEPKWLDHFARAFVLLGLVLSLVEFRGITTVNQILEIGIAAGFLMGTYLMAKDNINGYLWLLLGNVTCAALMGIEGYVVLMTQQLASVYFVTNAYLTRRRNKNGSFNIPGV